MCDIQLALGGGDTCIFKRYNDVHVFVHVHRFTYISFLAVYHQFFFQTPPVLLLDIFLRSTIS
jgi:hypothetical protein